MALIKRFSACFLIALDYPMDSGEHLVSESTQVDFKISMPQRTSDTKALTIRSKGLNLTKIKS